MATLISLTPEQEAEFVREGKRELISSQLKYLSFTTWRNEQEKRREQQEKQREQQEKQREQQEKQREQQEKQMEQEKDRSKQQEKQMKQQEKQMQMEQERGKEQVKKSIWCVPYDGLVGEAGAPPSENEVGQNVTINEQLEKENQQEESDYGYEKNSYPLEQLDADIENMMNSDEFKDAIESLKYEMEKEYYDNE